MPQFEGIDPSQFLKSLKEGGLSDAEVKKVAKAWGVALKESTLEAYKEFSKAAETLEKRVSDFRLKELNKVRDRLNILEEQEIDALRRKGATELEQLKVREKYDRKRYQEEKQAYDDVKKRVKELTRVGVGEQIKNALKKEVTSLPFGVGGFASSVGEGGIAGGLATGGIIASVAAVSKFIEELVNVTKASNKSAIAFEQAGIKQQAFGKIFDQYQQGIPKGMVAANEFAEFIGKMGEAPRALEEASADGFKGLKRFQDDMAKRGIPLSESLDRIIKASSMWGGSIKDLTRQEILANKMMELTGYNFNTLYNVMQDLDPTFKSMTFSAREASDASRFLAANLTMKLGKEGLQLTNQEVSDTAKSLGGFVSSLTSSKWAGIIASTTGRMPTGDQVAKLAGDPVEALKMYAKFFSEKFLKPFGGNRAFAEEAAGQAGFGPGNLGLPKQAQIFAESIDAIGDSKEASDKLKRALMDANVSNEILAKQAKSREQANFDGMQALANMQSPLENLAKAITTIVQQWVDGGTLINSINGLNQAITHPGAAAGDFVNKEMGALRTIGQNPMTALKVAGGAVNPLAVLEALTKLVQTGASNLNKTSRR